MRRKFLPQGCWNLPPQYQSKNPPLLFTDVISHTVCAHTKGLGEFQIVVLRTFFNRYVWTSCRRRTILVQPAHFSIFPKKPKWIIITCLAYNKHFGRNKLLQGFRCFHQGLKKRNSYIPRLHYYHQRIQRRRPGGYSVLEEHSYKARRLTAVGYSVHSSSRSA